MDPDDFPDLEIWLKAGDISGADGDPVATWEDAANANDFAEATSGEQPRLKTGIVNSLPVVRFDGSDDRLISAYAPSGSVTVFCVAAYRSHDGSYPMLFSCVDEGNPDGGFQVYLNMSFLDISSGTGGAWPSGVTFDGVLTDTDFHVHTLQIGPSGTKYRIDGAVIYSSAVGEIAEGLGLVLGNHAASLVYPGAVDIAEFVLYDAAKSDTDAVDIAVGLGAKYGITINEGSAPTDISIDNATIAENEAVGTTIGNLTATDSDPGDVFVFSLAPATLDNDSFAIDGDVLKSTEVFNYEDRELYTIRVIVTDSFGLDYDEDLVITVTDVAEGSAPTDISLDNATIAENAGGSASVGTLSATDADAGDTVTFTLPSGIRDNDLFEIDDDSLQAIASFDYEARSLYTVTVRATDSYGLYREEDFVITVTNVNEAPTDIALSNTTVADGSASGTTVGTLSSTDPDAGDSVTFSLAAATLDNDDFTIDGDSLKIGFTADAGTRSGYTIQVTAHDSGGLTFDENFTISITATDSLDEEQRVMELLLPSRISGGTDTTLSASQGLTVPTGARRLRVQALAQNVRYLETGDPTASTGYQISTGQTLDFVVPAYFGSAAAVSTLEAMRFIEETSGAKLAYSFFAN
jgi:hypothetical protein